MDWQLLVFMTVVLLMLAGCAVCIWLRDRAGVALMGGLLLYLAWVEKRLFRSH